MLKFSAVSQIWKKYIQKLNDWDLPLNSINLVLFERTLRMGYMHAKSHKISVTNNVIARVDDKQTRANKHTGKNMLRKLTVPLLSLMGLRNKSGAWL